MQQKNQEYLNNVTDLPNMFSSLAIRIEKNVLKDFLVSDSSQSKSYCDVIVAEIKEVSHEQETKMRKMKRKTLKKQEVMERFRIF